MASKGRILIFFWRAILCKTFVTVSAMILSWNTLKTQAKVHHLTTLVVLKTMRNLQWELRRELNGSPRTQMLNPSQGPPLDNVNSPLNNEEFAVGAEKRAEWASQDSDIGHQRYIRM